MNLDLIFGIIQIILIATTQLVFAGIGELDKIELYLNDIRRSGFIIKSVDFMKVEN